MTKDNLNLKKHIKSIHEGIKIACDKCAYKASSNGNLKNIFKEFMQNKNSVYIWTSLLKWKLSLYLDLK